MIHSLFNRALLLIILVSTACISHAHTRSQSFSTWLIQDNQVHLTVSILSREVTRLAADESIDVSLPLPTIYSNHIKDRILLSVDGKGCLRSADFTPLPSKNGYIRLESQFNCSVTESLNLQFSGMFDIVPSHLHYAHVKQKQGPSFELVFSDATREMDLNLNQERQSTWDTSINYINLGIEHILIGLDHLVFLLALILLCQNMRQVLILITGFTLGHSITLTFSVLGWLQPATVTVEALIGFSIVLVVLEIVQRRQADTITSGLILSLKDSVGLKVILPLVLFSLALKGFSGVGLPIITLLGVGIFALAYLQLSAITRSVRIQFLLTVAFGFIHGFGFAEVLREIGLPADQLGIALFAFNIGVEIGQVFALLAVAPIIYAISKYASTRAKSVCIHTCLILIFFVGNYWFVSRSLSF